MRAAARPSLVERWDALGRPLLRLSRWGAVLVLALIVAAMAWSVAGGLTAGRTAPPASVAAAQSGVTGSRPAGDMALYARIGARMDAGKGYYSAALGEQRASGYPTRPFVTVRLPTLAWMQTATGTLGVRIAVLGLAAACLLSLWWRRPAVGALPERLGASVLLLLGAGAAFSEVAAYDHDFVAGMLLTLALLAYRPHRWWPALLVAGAALAVRELAAPFAALWLAFALGGRRWHEAAGVAALLAVFALGLACHAAAVGAAQLPGDLVSQGWSGLAGYRLPLTALGDLTGLRFLPACLAAPLAIVPLVGWAGLGGRLGLFALLWFAGLATMMALFARPANFYWVELGLPAYGLGLAFAPRALSELVRTAFGPTSRQS